MKDAIGWAASVILLLTLMRQVYTQWKSKSSEGVSRWLYVGQVAASIGFIVYSWLLDSWVFIVTNSLILLNTLVGLWIYFHHAKSSGAQSGHAAQDQSRAA